MVKKMKIIMIRLQIEHGFWSEVLWGGGLAFLAYTGYTVAKTPTNNLITQLVGYLKIS